MQNVPLAALSPPVVVSDSILLRIDAKLPSGCLGSSCGRSLFISYQELMQNGHLAALALPVAVPYSFLFKN